MLHRSKHLNPVNVYSKTCGIERGDDRIPIVFLTLDRARGKLGGRGAARPSSLPHDLYIIMHPVRLNGESIQTLLTPLAPNWMQFPWCPQMLYVYVFLLFILVKVLSLGEYV